MKFLALQNNPVGRVETKDEVCLDFQKKKKKQNPKTFAKFYNQSL